MVSRAAEANGATQVSSRQAATHGAMYACIVCKQFCGSRKNFALNSLSCQLRLCTHAPLGAISTQSLDSLLFLSFNSNCFNASCCMNTTRLNNHQCSELRSFAREFMSLSPKRDSVDESRKCKRAAVSVELILICNFVPSNLKLSFVCKRKELRNT